MKKLLLLLALWSSAAFAQDIPNHAVPVSRGPGTVGWGTLGPCSAGQTFVWPNNTSDPICTNIPTTTPVTTVVNDLATWGNVTGSQLLDAGGGTVGGAYNFTGNSTYSGTALFTGAPFTVTTNGQATIGQTATLGAALRGQGSTNDFTLQNKSGTTVCQNATGSTILNCNTLTLTNPLAVAQGGTGKIVATLPTVQSFTTGSGTYTTPAGVVWIRVKMVGGGGGGAGSGSTTAPSGGTGGNTTFGTTLLVANGGTGGAGTINGNTVTAGGTGGTASLGTGPIGWAFAGQNGGNGWQANTSTTQSAVGGSGGSSCFGGAGPATGNGNTGSVVVAGVSAVANTGSGGSGASAASSDAGGGGAAGGCLEGIINTPSATYSYAVGAGGAGGIGTGTNAGTGGAGAAGIIVVEEHYNN